MRTTSGYTRHTSGLVLLVLLMLPLGEVRAQFGAISSIANSQASSSAPVRKEKKLPEVTYPLMNGIEVGVDLWGPVGKVLGADALTLEAQGALNLKNRYLPSFSLGYSSSDFELDKDFSYRHKGVFGRIGLDYNTLWKKKHGNMVLVGIRYGFTSMSYDLSATALKDAYWPQDTPYPEGHWTYRDMKATLGWLEVSAGFRTHISGGLFMGWNLSVRWKLNASTGENGQPYYVPGYGKYGSSAVGVTYFTTYKF